MNRLVGLCALLAGCYSPSFELPCTVRCDQRGQCPSQLACDTNDGVCKLPGGGCATDGGTTEVEPDARIDADIRLGEAGMNCFGSTMMFQECFGAPPAQDWIISSVEQQFDTGGSNCDIALPNGDSPLCVMYRTTFRIDPGAILRPSGSRALVIVAGSISVLGTLDASSQPSPKTQGPGGGWASCPIHSAPPTDLGGGAGGSFASIGGAGGAGNNDALNGGKPGAVASPISAHGGCNGQVGDGGGAGPAAYGGGAVLLISKAPISISGGITVAGSGGAGGGLSSGGSGGGAGGLILFDAPSISDNGGWLVADGGGGGCGGNVGISGQSGRTRDHNGASGACTTATGSGGDGAHASFGAGDGFAGVAGTGGGGGGGGGGSIRFAGGAAGVADSSPAAGQPQ